MIPWLDILRSQVEGFALLTRDLQLLANKASHESGDDTPSVTHVDIED